MADTASELMLLTAILELRCRLRANGQETRFVYLRPGFLDRLKEEIAFLLDQSREDGGCLAGMLVIEREGLADEYDYLVMPSALKAN